MRFPGNNSPAQHYEAYASSGTDGDSARAPRAGRFALFRLGIFQVLVGLALWGAPAAQALAPYTNDANTVLLQHFDGSTSGSITAVYSASGPCGGPYPSTGYAATYPASQSGMGNALRLCHPEGLTELAYSAITFSGELLSQANGTLEFWLHVSSYGNGGVSLISQGMWFGACSGWTFGMSLNATGVVQASAWAGFDVNSGTTTVPLNQWTHIALSWGSTGAKLYISGQLVGTDASTGAPAAGFSGSFLGPFGTAEIGACTMIDELRISNVQRTSFEANPPSLPSLGGFWMFGGSMSAPRYDAAAGVINGQLYVAEGTLGGGPTMQNETYTPPYFAWSTRTPGTIQRANPASAVVGDQLYLVGGCFLGNCSGGVTNITEAYSTNSGTWTRKAPMPTARTRATAAALGNRLYVFGGATGGSPLASSAVVEAYDPVTDTWTAKTPMPTARDNAMAAAIGGKIYVVGGYVSSSGQRVGTLEVYDPASDSWTTKTPMPTARERAALGIVNGRMHIVGGENSSGALRVHEVYDPATDSWQTAAPRQLSTTRLPSGALNVGASLIVPGGYSATAVETYLPNLTGPVYPPPSFVNFYPAGDIGRSGGVTWYFSNAQLPYNTYTFWGPTNNGVRLSFNNSTFANPGEVMTYQPSQSDLCANTLVWTGTTTIPGVASTIYTRCLVSVTTPNGTPCLIDRNQPGSPGQHGGLASALPGTGVSSEHQV